VRFPSSVSLPSYSAAQGIQGVFKNRPNFCYKDLFYNILSAVPFTVVPSTGNAPFPTFLPLLECFLERTFYDGAQFSYRIFLNLRVFKKRPKFLNSSPTSTEDALRLLSAPSGEFWQQTAICPVSLWALVVELHPLNWSRAQAVRRIDPPGALSSRSASFALVGEPFKSSIFFFWTQVCNVLISSEYEPLSLWKIY
jgi:hypothetical protein